MYPELCFFHCFLPLPYDSTTFTYSYTSLILPFNTYTCVWKPPLSIRLESWQPFSSASSFSKVECSSKPAKWGFTVITAQNHHHLIDQHLIGSLLIHKIPILYSKSTLFRARAPRPEILTIRASCCTSRSTCTFVNSPIQRDTVV